VKVLLIGLALVFIALTVLPVVRHDYWVIRVCDFPRLQIAGAGVLLLAVYFVLWGVHRLVEEVVLAGLFAAVVYQAYWIWPYTPYTNTQVHDATGEDPDSSLSVLVANVWIQNRQAQPFLDLVAEADPDLILVLETDQWWVDHLDALEEEYPHVVHHPQDNPYGLALYARYPLHDATVRFLVDDEVPSVRARVELPSGQRVWFYGVHPRPPHPEEHRNSIQRDAELLLVGHEVGMRMASDDDPVVVAGDFNDVSWSYVTLMMRRISGLLDPRIGRGAFNTFHAQYPFFRCPLDHVLHSDHFTLEHLERLPDFGSDHFALLTRLQFDENAPEVQERPYADSRIRQHAREEIGKALQIRASKLSRSPDADA
jgi:endonuclease/exonuclease/phosphatase (EEP) superfamily protein YafD